MDNPGIAGRPGIVGAAGADGAAGAVGACWSNPGSIPWRPGVVAGAAGAAGPVSPGIEGIPAAGGVAGVAAEGTPGKLMPGVAGAEGGVAPNALARFCRICGALAAELISCCGMFGTGGAGTGSAWAIPPVSNAADEPTTTAVARK